MHSLQTNQPYAQNRIDELIEPIAPFLIELIGTMMLIFTIGCVSITQTTTPSTVDFGGLAIGFCLIVLVFLGGHISGAHYNPAVTYGILITMREKISWRRALGYVLMQLIGSLIGSALVFGCTGGGWDFGPKVSRDYSVWEGFVCEIVATFFLLSVVLNVATTEAQEDNSFFGLAIGLTVASMAIAVGGISGGAFNPAVGTGPHLFQLMLGHGFYEDMWIYWAGPILGATLAGLFFRVTNVQEYKYKQDLAMAARGLKKQ